MNDDGTIKDQYKNTDFSAVMAGAKKTGNTATYNAAATARFYKIMSDYGQWGKYDDGNYMIPGQQQTETGRQFDLNNATENKNIDANLTLGLDSNAKNLEGTKHTNNTNYNSTVYTTDASERIASGQNETEINKIKVGAEEERNNAEFAATLSTPFTWSKVGLEKANSVIKSINKSVKAQEDTEGYFDDGAKDLISESSDGKWTVNLPNGTKLSSWVYHIAGPILKDASLSEDEAAAILSALGYTWTDIEPVIRAYANDIEKAHKTSAGVETKLSRPTTQTNTKN
jgi:hypothetical protein